MNKLLEEIERLRKENEQLRQKVAELEAQVFGGPTK